MVLVRVVTVLGIGLSLVAILLQNQTPTLALVFLGVRSQSLPLGLWTVGAVVIGALISLGLSALLAVAAPSPRNPRRRPKAKARWSSPFKRPQSKPREPINRSSTGYSDWDEPVATDWYGEPQSDPFFDDEPEYEDARDNYPEEDDYDDPTPPWEKRDSSYSFSDRNPNFANQSGQRESVFDAEYRVINPPQEASPKDDWDEFEDQF